MRLLRRVKRTPLDVPGWIMLVHEDLRTSHDFCGWECAAGFTLQRALDAPAERHGGLATLHPLVTKGHSVRA
jgi:hypothetical protein